MAHMLIKKNEIYDIVCIPFYKSYESFESSCLVFKNSSLRNQQISLPNQRNQLEKIPLKLTEKVSLNLLCDNVFQNTNTLKKFYFSEIRKEFRKKVLQNLFYSIILGLPYFILAVIKVNTIRHTSFYATPTMFAVISLPSSGITISTSPNLGEISQATPVTEGATTPITFVPSTITFVP